MQPQAHIDTMYSHISLESVSAACEEVFEYEFDFDHPGDAELRGVVFMPFLAGESVHDLGDQNVRWAVDMGMLRRDEPGFMGLLKGGFEDLATLVYRDDSWDDVALAANFMTMLFVFDDLVDSELSPIGSSYATAVTVTDYLMKAVYGEQPGELPEGTPYKAKLTGIANALIDIHQRIMDRAAEVDPGWYYASMRDYFDGVVSESRSRSNRAIHGVDDYAAVRLQFSAVLPCFELGLLMQGLELSDELRASPSFRSMQRAAVLSVSYVNDLFSYRKEFLAGERSNLVMVLERTEQLGRGEALAKACEIHTEVIREYKRAKRTLRFDAAYDEAAAYYVELMEYWMRGNLDWTMDNRTQRYCEASSTDIPVVSLNEYTTEFDADWAPSDESSESGEWDGFDFDGDELEFDDVPRRLAVVR
ncbi:MAG: hypothetical protein HC927_13905 [Deltaproteobacteria bacterium]|nr:hypothetical protein [Deltaproteobacteria bacterium]